MGGALSSADIFAVLYGSVLNIDPKQPNDPDRDRFILSKGHVALGHYATLAEAGFMTQEELTTFEQSGSEISTHEVMNQEKGIEVSGGSLGYGLSIGVGIALNAKRKQRPYQTFVLLGDGECNEGTVWEAAMSASRFQLNNLTAIVDMNGQSLDGYTRDVMPIANPTKVWEGFGWQVTETDGNDVECLLEAFCDPRDSRPRVILAHTKKGKGVATIEDQVGWHHARLNQEQYEQFVKELESAE